MRLRVLFGLTILLGSLVSCATGGKFGGNGGGGGEGGSGSGAEGGGATTTTTAGGGTTTDTSTDTTTTGMTTTTTAPPCEESPCKLVPPQCGCEGGEMCTINTTGARTCRAPGDVAPGDVCVGLYSCQPGSLCIQASGSVSLCAPYCDNDAQCAGAAVCYLQLNDPQNPGQLLPGVKLCTDDCNPINNLGCPSGAKLGCQVYTDQGAGVTFTLCAGAGTATQGQACNGVEDCAPGHSCFTLGDGTKQCLQFCNVGNPSCPSCVSIDPPAIYNGVNYGACL